MIRLLTVIGARPQIIKAAAISRAVKTRFAGHVEEHILHTGQHYDAKVEIVEAGAGIIADADYERIMAAYEALVNKPVQFPALFGDGHASEKIISEIINYLDV